MPSLVTTGFNQKIQKKMMIFLDNEECMDDDNLSFSDDSYDAEVEPEVEQGDEDEEVSVYNEKENGMQPSKSHLRLRVLVNGEEISESDDSVGEVREETQTVVPWDGRVRILTIRFRRIFKYCQRPENIWNQDVQRVSPTTSICAWVKRAKEAKDSTKKQPKKKKREAYPKFET
jgi:hypothetical protein